MSSRAVIMIVLSAWTYRQECPCSFHQVTTLQHQFLTLSKKKLSRKLRLGIRSIGLRGVRRIWPILGSVAAFLINKDSMFMCLCQKPAIEAILSSTPSAPELSVNSIQYLILSQYRLLKFMSMQLLKWFYLKMGKLPLLELVMGILNFMTCHQTR